MQMGQRQSTVIRNFVTPVRVEYFYFPHLGTLYDFFPVTAHRSAAEHQRMQIDVSKHFG